MQVPGGLVLLRRHQDDLQDDLRGLPGAQDGQQHRARLRHRNPAFEGAGHGLFGRLAGQLFVGRLRHGPEAVRLHLHHHLLSSIGAVRHRVLDLVPHPDGRHSRQDGPARHSLPRAGQHFQHGHDEHAQGRGFDGHRSLDVGVYPIRLRSVDRVSELNEPASPVSF